MVKRIIILLIICVIVVGCMSSKLPVVSTQSRVSAAPSITSTGPVSTIFPRPSLPPTLSAEATLMASIPNYQLTPPATLTSDQVVNVQKMWNLQECILPCYFQIIPGKTMWLDAKSILEKPGGRFVGSWYGASKKFEFLYLIQSTELGEKVRLSQNVELSVFDGVVQRVEVKLFAMNNPGGYSLEQIGHFGIKNIFNALSAPDKIVFSKSGEGYLIGFYYESTGVVVELSEIISGTQVCPISDKFLSLHLILTNKDSNLGLFLDNWVPLTDTEIYMPINRLLTVDSREFYESILSKEKPCFDVLQN